MNLPHFVPRLFLTLVLTACAWVVVLGAGLWLGTALSAALGAP